MTQRGPRTRTFVPASKPSQRLRDRQPVRNQAVAGRRLSYFLPLGPAEQLLLGCCRAGEVARLAEQRPEAPNATNRIRAIFLRFLLLGGDEQAPVHERGVRMSGYWVDGGLDLGGCAVPFSVALVHSHFAGLLCAQDARLGGLLSLEGSCLSRGMNADRLQVNGGMFLRGGFLAKREVRLLGAQIGGNLDCSNGQFEMMEGEALSAERAVVKGGLFLRGLKPAACLNLSHAEVGVLADEVAAWAPGSVLDGFRYGALGGDAPTSGAERLAWLLKQPEEELGKSFRPQPWRQLQRVLREMGHHEDAKQIGIAFENRLRAIGHVGQSAPTTPAIVAKTKQHVARGAHFCFGLLVGYGFRPLRLLAWMLGVWLVWGVLFWLLALPPFSALAPSDPLVFQNPAYETCLPDRSPTPGNWFLCAPLRGEYATFSPFAFSLDILLPLVDLGQEKYWGAFVPTPKPAVTEEILNLSSGHVARMLIWLETLFGWVCSLLLVAIVSGLARRSEDD